MSGVLKLADVLQHDVIAEKLIKNSSTVMSDKDMLGFKNSINCKLCGKELGDNRVREHEPVNIEGVLHP